VMIQNHFFQHVDIGLETLQILQVDQKFLFHRPIRVGDELTGTMHIESVDERFGADIVTTRNVCAELDGTVVMEAFTTLMGHEGDNSVSMKWDAATGQVVRTAATGAGPAAD
jgi:acyl-CoA thioesterase FadM